MPNQETPELYQFDIGTRFLVRVFEKDVNGDPQPADLTGTSSRTIRFRKPGKIAIDRAMSDVDLVNGVVEYVTISGDIDIAGLWWFQVLIVTGASRDQATNARSFVVGERLEAP